MSIWSQIEWLGGVPVVGLGSSVEYYVGLRERGQGLSAEQAGWTDSQLVSSLILLSPAGGESVADMDVLERDGRLCRTFLL